MGRRSSLRKKTKKEDGLNSVFLIIEKSFNRLYAGEIMQKAVYFLIILGRFLIWKNTVINSSFKRSNKPT